MSRFVSAFSTLARTASPEVKTIGLSRVRITSQGPDGRVSLQMVSRDGELPDAGGVNAFGRALLWSGTPGVSVEVTPGQEAILGFARADASDPIVFAAAPKGQPGHVPIRVMHEATTEIRFFESSAGVVRIGPTTTASVAIAPKVAELAAALNAAFVATEAFAAAVVVYADALATIIPTHVPAAVALSTAASTYATAITTTLSSALAALNTPYPAGYFAVRLEAQ